VVTGYLYNPSADGGYTAVTGVGATHAWADIYLPGAGWIAYDPTNGTVNGANLIRVAVTRDISQAVPIAGSFVGGPDDCLGMTVDVAVILGRGAAVCVRRDHPAWRCLTNGIHELDATDLCECKRRAYTVYFGHELGELAPLRPDFLEDDLLGLG
jgi:hypothetical protein